jgi:hydroxymethylpyrimidine/phosphomethylpyrimidine kinase
MTLPVALTIAGSDSGGGAGIQADLKTFHAFGVFGTTAITAVTVQDTGGVHGVHAVPVDIVRRQIEVVARDLEPAACKTGMLATAELVDAVAASIRGLRLRRYVLDPVMVATSGTVCWTGTRNRR